MDERNDLEEMQITPEEPVAPEEGFAQTDAAAEADGSEEEHPVETPAEEPVEEPAETLAEETVETPDDESEDAAPAPQEPAPEKPKKPKKKHRALKVILLILLFIAIAAAAGFIAINVKYKMLEKEVAETAPMVHGEIDRGIATKEICDFYFNTLTYREQLLYNNIKEAAKACAESSEELRHEYDIETFSKVAKYVLADNPDLFYVNFDRLVLNHGWHRTYVTMAYCASGDELKSIIAEYESAISDMIAASTDAKSDFERELALHDYIIDLCEYAVEDKDHLYNTAYGALVLKRAYCDGYAYAMKAALDRLDIQSAIVYGSVNGTDHVWNLVLIDGQYYHLDTMWDDADFSFGEGMRFHGYFNLDDERIKLDHEYKYADVLPEANGKSDYYTALGLHAATEEECTDIIFDALVDAADEDRAYIELLCDTTSSNEDLAPYFQEAADRANKELDEETFLTAFRVFSASETSNAVTIQVFYPTPVEDDGADTAEDTTEDTAEETTEDTTEDTKEEGN